MAARVLIVEDNREMREILRMTIEPCAEIVGECADGAEVLSAYRRLHPDFVLMDIELPNVDGITAARQIIEEDPEAKIVMVTNYNDEPMRKAAREAGARQYILKENLLDVLPFINRGNTPYGCCERPANTLL